MEIEFRGKTIKGRWVYGLVSVVKDKAVGVEPGTYISNGSGMPFAYQIRPETLGQYTGLVDKTGVKIFTGDILQYGKNKNWRYTVFFEDGRFTWAFEDGLILCQKNLNYKQGYSVIGNIYE